MKRLAIVVLVFAIFSLIVPVAQGATPDYPALKNEYITNHPGQAIIPFPWEPGTSIKVLPFNYAIPAAPANNISITACRDQFESGSFIITAQKDLSGITIGVPDLYSAQGNRIPADAMNVRLVKAWYQADDTNIYIYHPGSRYLTPELLLKDDSLVKVDYVNKVNYLKVTINGVQQYIDISSPSGTFPSNAQFQDAPSLQPFSLAANENKQVWLTMHVPAATPAGDYYGNISLTASTGTPVLMNVRVTVLPFDLEASPLEYALYYRGGVTSTAQPGISASYKTPAQYATELKNMKEHGIAYPTLYQEDWTLWSNALTLRQQAGLPNDHIYVVEWGTGNPTDAAGLATLQRGITTVKNLNAPFGYKDTYIYGMDEAKGDLLRSETAAWQATHASGAKVFAACFNDAVDISGDLLDVAVLDNSLDPAQAAAWHSHGKRILSYDNPQVGVENPEIYRKNYGFALWNAGFDGAMDYAYQHDFGHMWNDFDDSFFRDHVFAYQTSNGVIDTVQWEGWREGVDDTRYVASLMKRGVSAASVRATITDSLSRGDSMATLRKKVISQIPVSSPPAPTLTPSPTPTPTSTPIPTQTPSPSPTLTPAPAPTLQASTGSITVTSPNGGESWASGSSPKITWTSSGNVGSMVKIEVLKAGAVVQTISDENDSSYNSWVISSGLGTGTDYRVRITSVTNPAITDTGNSNFAITSGTSAGSITVTSPNGGESWASGSSPRITWTSSGTVGSMVKIEVLKAGAVVQTINDENDSSYNSWVISSGLGTGTDYRVRITSVTNPAITDTSNSNFTITSGTSSSSITVTAPDGGQTWKRGTSQTITWNYTGSPGTTVKIVLLKGSTEVGTIASSVSLGSSGKGSYRWRMSSSGMTGSDFRVSIQSISQPTIKDASNNYFTITS